MMKDTLYLLLDKKDFKKKFKNNINLFTLNKFVLSDIDTKNINHIFPDPYKTAKNSESLILKTQEVKIQLIKEIREILFFKKMNNLDELLDPFLEIKLSSYFYLNDIIPIYKKYILIFGGKLYKYNSKIDLINSVEKIYTNKINKNQLLNKFSNINLNFFNRTLLFIQKFLLKNLLKSSRRNINFFSDEEAYFIKILKKEIGNKANSILFYTPTCSYLRIIQILFKQLFLLIFNVNYKEIGMFLLPSNDIYFKYYELKNKNKLFKINYLDDKFTAYLRKQIFCNALYSFCYEKYLTKIFKNIKVKRSYFHSLRFSDLFTFSRVLKEFNKNVFLISHGSHTLHVDNNLDIFASKTLAFGMTYTNEKGIKILSQSQFCDDFLDSLQIRYHRINRLIQNNFVPKKVLNASGQKNITKILFIGTVKQLGARRYYVESSGEFIESVNLLYRKLFKHKNLFRIIVRIRNVINEIDQDILDNAFKEKKDLIEIGSNDSIYQEIQNSDCLISYSSTTLEEGFSFNKPVMSFGLPNYNHFSFYENQYRNDNNSPINENLKIIESCLERKFIYKNNEHRVINHEF